MSRRLARRVTWSLGWSAPVVLALAFGARIVAQQSGSASSPISAITPASWTSIGPTNIGGRVRAFAVHPTAGSTLFAGGANGGIWKSTDSGASWAPVNDYLPSLAITSIIFQPGNASVMYAGTGEAFSTVDGARGVGILKSTDGGAHWTLLGATATANFYYVNRLAMSADGSVLLAATSTGLFRSTDGGASFTQVISVSAASFGYTEIVDVKFLVGSSTAAVAAGNSENVYRSSDGGASWTAATGPTALTNNNTAPRGVAIGVATSSTVYLSVNDNLGEVWKSTDAGASYTKISAAGQPAHLESGNTANAIWVDPTNANVVVVGGGDLFRSSDGGVNWTKLSSKDFFPDGLSIHGSQHIIVADAGYDASANRRVYIGNDGGVWKTDDILAAPHGTVHPCCNTIDFTPLNNGLAITQFFGGAGDPATGAIVGGTQGNGTLNYSAGGAAAWMPMGIDDGTYAGIDPTAPNYRYGSFPYLRLYRSASGGPQATLIDGCGKAAQYRLQDACDGNNNYVAPWMLDPNNPNRLLAGGISLWRSDDVKADVTDSTGPHWSAIKGSSGGSAISALAIQSGNSDYVWAGHNNGDLYTTSNGTVAFPTWQKVDDSGLPNRTITAIAVDPHNPDVAYVGFEGFNADSVWKTTSRGVSWTALTGTPALPIRSITIDTRASGFVFLGTDRGVFTSTDAGATWDATTVGPANTAIDQLFWMGSTLVAATHGRGMFTVPVASHVSSNVSSLAFSASRNGDGTLVLSFTPPQSVILTYDGADTPAWTVSAPSWITASNGGSGSFSVGVTNAGNAIGSNSSLSGSITFLASNVGVSLTIPVTLTVLNNGASDALLSLEKPLAGASVRQRGFTVSGFAIDRGSAVGSGINAVHVWAYALDGPSAGTSTFLGAAVLGGARPDVGAAYGPNFGQSGFTLIATGLTAGTHYRVMAFGRSAIANAFTASQSVDVLVVETVAEPIMAIEAPFNGGVIGPNFRVKGWAIDYGADTTTGVNTVHVWLYPRVGGGFGSPTFLGAATYGATRNDIGTLYGPQFTNSGFSLDVAGLAAGDYRIYAFERSTVTNSFSGSAFVDVTVSTATNPQMYVDIPTNGSNRSQPFTVAGWAIDLGSSSGTGVNAVHVWAAPVSGGPAIFTGAATYGNARPDVGAVFGAPFTNSGFNLSVTGLSPGQYDLFVYARSTVAGSFNQVRSVRVTVN